MLRREQRDVVLKGYCTPDQVAGFLGLTFDPAQNRQCEQQIELAEKLIDSYLKHSYLVGEQADEAHYAPFGRFLYLKHPPITAVSAVKGRTGLGATETTLVAGTDYEGRDLEAGELYLVSPGSYDRIRVTYTPATTVPGDITEATIEFVAELMRPHLVPGSHGAESYRLPDLEVVYAKGVTRDAFPPRVALILDMCRFRSVA